jgi:hypothetical protein
MQAAWDKVKDASDKAVLKAFVDRYPSSPRVPDALARIEDLRQSEARKEAALQRKEQEATATNPNATPPSSSPTPAVNTPELVTSAQQELIRLGCLSGDADGILGDDTRAAIKRYLSQTGTRTDQIAVTEQFILELDKQQSRICPLICPGGKIAKGDVCVAQPQPQPAISRPPPQPAVARPQPQPARPQRSARPSDDDDDVAPPSRRQQRNTGSSSSAPKATAAAPKPQVRQQAVSTPRFQAPAAAIRGGGGGGGGPMIGVGF